jgi:hypothetical protein
MGMVRRGLLVGGLFSSLGLVFSAMALTDRPAAEYLLRTATAIEAPAMADFKALSAGMTPLHQVDRTDKGDRLPFGILAAPAFTPGGIEEDADADIHDEEINSLPANTSRIAKQ